MLAVQSHGNHCTGLVFWPEELKETLHAHIISAHSHMSWSRSLLHVSYYAGNYCGVSMWRELPFSADLRPDKLCCVGVGDGWIHGIPLAGGVDGASEIDGEPSLKLGQKYALKVHAQTVTHTHTYPHTLAVRSEAVISHCCQINRRLQQPFRHGNRDGCSRGWWMPLLYDHAINTLTHTHTHNPLPTPLQQPFTGK